MKTIREYLKRQSESTLWDAEGDDQHSGRFYQAGAASCFFPVAARTLVRDGLDASNVATFCIHGALEALTESGLSIEQAESKLLEIVMACRITEEISDRRPS